MQRDEETTSTNGRLRDSTTVMLVSPSSSLTSSTDLGSSIAGLGEDIRRWRMISPLVLSALRGSTIHHMGVWASFMAGVAATGWGLSNMLLDPERKAFLGMGFTFMTASAFTLAKTLRDRQEAEAVKHLVDSGVIRTEGGPDVGESIVSSIGGSAGWVLHAWLAFGASVGLTTWGLLNLPIADERKIFLATSGLLLLTSTTNLVQSVRDRMDARRWTALLEEKRSKRMEEDLNDIKEGNGSMSSSMSETDRTLTSPF